MTSPSHRRPRVTLLEDRIDPATLVVTSPLDDPHQLQVGTFRAALASANNGDIITFAPSLIGQTIQEGASGGPEGFVIAKNIRIMGPGAGQLTIRGISGGQVGINQRVIDIRPGIFTAISGLTIAGGSGFGVDNGGGGIRNLGSVSLRDVNFVGNSASFGGSTFGGAFYNGGSAFFFHCTFSNNVASAMPSRHLEPAPELAYGGAIYSAGGRVDVIGCTFKQNTATASGLRNADAYGGAIYTVSTELHIRDTLFSENSARGDSSHIFFIGSSATGGAIDVDGGTMTLDSSTFVYNTAIAQDAATGGAIAVTGYANVVARNVTLSHNEVRTSPVVMFVASSATAHGAAIGVIQGNLNLNSATISENVASLSVPPSANVTPSSGGGGLYNASDANPVFLRNTIIANNYVNGPSASGPDISGTVFSLGHNLITVTQGSTILGNTSGNIYGQDPRLAPIADNGGPTPTRALEAGSPAINAGSTNLLTDQRGHRRGSPPDIGAFER